MKTVPLFTLMVFFQARAVISLRGNTNNTCHREPVFGRHCWRPAVQDNPCVLGTLHDSYLMLDPEYQAPTADVRSYKNISYSKFKGNDQCAWQNGNSYSSSCPHHYVLNYDENRRPNTLIEAKCNCDENTPCLNGTETSRCVPVKYYITVLRKNGCRVDGKYSYTTAIEPITVGCTCAYPQPMVLTNTDNHIVSSE